MGLLLVASVQQCCSSREASIFHPSAVREETKQGRRTRGGNETEKWGNTGWEWNRDRNGAGETLQTLAEAGTASQSVPSFPSGSWLGLFLLIPCVEVDGTGRWDQGLLPFLSVVLGWCCFYCTWDGASVLGQGWLGGGTARIKAVDSCCSSRECCTGESLGWLQMEIYWVFLIAEHSLYPELLWRHQARCSDVTLMGVMVPSQYSSQVYIFGCYSHSITVPCACGRNEATDSIKYKIIIDKAWPSLSRPLVTISCLITTSISII